MEEKEEEKGEEGGEEEEEGGEEYVLRLNLTCIPRSRPDFPGCENLMVGDVVSLVWEGLPLEQSHMEPSVVARKLGLPDEGVKT